ncbi:MAG: hypothetical protein LBE27_00280 [Deltaproteobacteria bacterium]|jgi:hypothetical protein|nr:hypothetical protein [Deltaproteobacteria bacterium]
MLNFMIKQKRMMELLRGMSKSIFHIFDRICKVVFFMTTTVCLDSLGVYDENGKSFGEVQVTNLTNELVLSDLALKILDCVFEFWPVGAKDDKVRHICIVEFELKKNKQLASKHIGYINSVVEKYSKRGIKLNIYFVVIYGPKISPKAKFVNSYLDLNFRERQKFLRLVSEDGLFSVLKEIKASGKVFQPWEVLQFIFLPGLVAPFDNKLLFKCFDFWAKNVKMFSGIHADVFWLMLNHYHQHLTEAQMSKLFDEIVPAPIYLELCKNVDKKMLEEASLIALEKGRQEARQEARQEISKIQASAAVTLLKKGVPRKTIREALKVSDQFLLNLEKKLKLKKP